MVEILGNNLASLFENTKLNGVCTYKGIPQKEFDITYEVWEVSDNDFTIMCEMTEERFEAYCPDGWWRQADGSVMGIPNTNFIINGKKIVGWDSPIYTSKKGHKYTNLSEYLCECIGVSQPRNVCALLTDLAKYNNMKMSELMRKYEGKT